MLVQLDGDSHIFALLIWIQFHPSIYNNSSRGHTQIKKLNHKNIFYLYNTTQRKNIFFKNKINVYQKGEKKMKSLTDWTLLSLCKGAEQTSAMLRSVLSSVNKERTNENRVKWNSFFFHFYYKKKERNKKKTTAKQREICECWTEPNKVIVFPSPRICYPYCSWERNASFSAGLSAVVVSSQAAEAAANVTPDTKEKRKKKKEKPVQRGPGTCHISEGGSCVSVYRDCGRTRQRK
jgi:hypothetical protein